jgi:hypothetical protein
VRGFYFLRCGGPEGLQKRQSTAGPPTESLPERVAGPLQPTLALPRSNRSRASSELPNTRHTTPVSSSIHHQGNCNTQAAMRTARLAALPARTQATPGTLPGTRTCPSRAAVSGSVTLAGDVLMWGTAQPSTTCTPACQAKLPTPAAHVRTCRQLCCIRGLQDALDRHLFQIATVARFPCPSSAKLLIGLLCVKHNTTQLSESVNELPAVLRSSSES